MVHAPQLPQINNSVELGLRLYVLGHVFRCMTELIHYVCVLYLDPVLQLSWLCDVCSFWMKGDVIKQQQRQSWQGTDESSLLPLLLSQSVSQVTVSL